MVELRTLRLERGISRSWLARELGISYTTLWRYEGRDASVPKSILFHAAHLLRVTPEELTHEAH